MVNVKDSLPKKLKQILKSCLQKALSKSHEGIDHYLDMSDQLEALPLPKTYMAIQQHNTSLYALLVTEEIPFVISTIQNLYPKPDQIDFERVAWDPHQNTAVVFVLKWERSLVDPQLLRENLLERMTLNRLAVEDRDAFIEQSLCIGADVQDADARSFLGWLARDHFTYLGYTSLGSRSAAKGKSLGFFRDRHFSFERLFDQKQQEELEQYLQNTAEPIIFLKSSLMSPVHRYVPMDVVLIRGKHPQSFSCFVGLYTAIAYSTAKQTMPFVSGKILSALKMLKMKPQSYEGKVMRHLVDTLPYDEVLQCSVHNLSKILKKTYEHHAHDRFGTIIFADPLNRYTNIILYIPNKSFDTNKFVRAQKVIEEIVQSDLALVNALLDFTSYGLVHFRTSHRLTAEHIKSIDSALAPIFEDWLKTLILQLKKTPYHHLLQLVQQNHQGLYSAKYRAATPVEQAILDLPFLNECISQNRRSARFYSDDKKNLHIRIVNPEGFLVLSDAFVSLDNFGLRVLTETSFTMQTSTNREVWIHDMRVEVKNSFVHAHHLKRNGWDVVVEALDKLWCGHLEDSYLNSLVTTEQLNWKTIVFLKALTHYLRQIGLGLQTNDLQFLIENYHRFFAHICKLFAIMHDPSIELTEDERHAQADHILRLCESYLFSVVDAEDERWLRCLLDTTRAVVRTNVYTTAFAEDRPPRIAIKIDTKKIKEAPEPKPYKEIFVYSSLFEGVHLRASAVARGGIRWSDRREDYRTEILGLLAAQIVKNGIIIPAGAKGGFVLKKSAKQFETSDDYRNFAIASYKTFIQSILDITDNIPHKKQRYLTYDAEDPYLVVAADKGTAAFSDYANEVAQANGFWLDDAFASGGKFGYSHKDLGITARGAWESAKHHFMQMGIDIQSESIRVVGVGDMSGDVFGNGMLCSETILLVAAFDHRHIFIDPHPAADISFQERQRLYALPKSSWDDYNKDLISRGGGVFSRHDKKIKITPAMREVFAIPAMHATLSAHQLIRYILCAPCDLLWFGGIGTFVSSSYEDAFSVKDPFNNTIRVHARDLHCRAIVEGANLAITQAARVEFAAMGGIINTDSIDNSAGVNCSDYEVNMKIVFQQLINQKRLTLTQRNQLLESVKDEVVGLILRNNILQNRLLTNMQEKLRTNPDSRSLLDFLRKNGLMNINALADMETRTAITRPELCLIISHVKNFLKEKLLLASSCHHKVFDDMVLAYFPYSLTRKFTESILQHPLRKNIIATTLANQIVNTMGADFPVRLYKMANAPWSHIVCVWYSIVKCLPHVKAEELSNKELEFMCAVLSFVLRTLPANFQNFHYTSTQTMRPKGTFWQAYMNWLNLYVPSALPMKDIIAYIDAHRWDDILMEILPDGMEGDDERAILGNLFSEVLDSLFTYILKQSQESPACNIHAHTILRVKAETFIHKVALAQNFLKILRS